MNIRQTAIRTVEASRLAAEEQTRQREITARRDAITTTIELIARILEIERSSINRDAVELTPAGRSFGYPTFEGKVEIDGLTFVRTPYNFVHLLWNGERHPLSSLHGLGRLIERLGIPTNDEPTTHENW